MLSLLWQIWYIIGLIIIVADGKVLQTKISPQIDIWIKI